ncbi:hypothetical protein [Halosegnis marinus]|uniref:Uncharacterized protein n=1 Tax=Halosegnis marinus TaxID=3034023 RepID=A0ABD5ZPA2_9EURY|nr:hypothetical protein [Halosegnis sp. DT85]
MLLQAGIPGGIELLVFNVIVAALVVYFTYNDARTRGANAVLWAGVMGLASLFLNIVGFLLVFAVYYVIVVRD